jgi:hypothetical protein
LTKNEGAQEFGKLSSLALTLNHLLIATKSHEECQSRVNRGGGGVSAHEQLKMELGQERRREGGMRGYLYPFTPELAIVPRVME